MKRRQDAAPGEAPGSFPAGCYLAAPWLVSGRKLENVENPSSLPGWRSPGTPKKTQLSPQPTSMATTMENKMQLIDGLIVSISDRIPRGPTQQPSNEIIQAVMKRSEADGTDVVDCSEWSTLQQYLRKELKLPNKLLFKFTGTITVGEKEMPQNIWNATGLASLRRTLLREPLEALEDRAVVELDLVLMGAMPKPQAPTPRTDKQKGHEQKRFNLQELVYGDTKRQKNVSGEWTEMASLFMMSDTDLMRQVSVPTNLTSRSHPPTRLKRALCVAAPPPRGDVREGHG